MKPVIGFVGLGIMGLPMARNAQKAGFRVVATNRAAARRDEAARAGIEVLSSPKAVAARAEAIVVMVTGPEAVRAVTTGPDGVFAAPVSGKTLIQTSTIDEKTTLEVAREARSRGMDFLDCPVTGSKKQVEDAQLIMLAGGPAPLVEKWRELLLSVGKAVVHAGDVGKGTALKLCMNLIVAQMTTALCESVALARTQGLPAEKIFDVISQSPALNCGYYQIKQKALLNADFSPAFSLANMLKDVRFMDAAAREAGAPLPVTAAVREVMERALAAGLGEQDLSTIINVLSSGRPSGAAR